MTPSTSRSYILGTAGHIDHGKSTLIANLTGVHPDRLAEEQRRGMTIELGFARLMLPSKRQVGVVDVPGHQAFVRHMIAGATGVDVALLVVAADDGIMPQTIEHLQILDLLGVRHLVVAITKCDLADDDLIDLVELELVELLEQTQFDPGATEVVRVSNLTLKGYDDLLSAIDRVLDRLSVGAPSQAGARLPIDRVFTLAGIGTVVTGTLWGGSVRTNDTLYLYPSGKQTRIKNVQVHGENTGQAYAGQRTALCLQGLSKDEVKRGEIASTRRLHLTDRMDVHLSYVGLASKPSAPLVSGVQVHVNHGTSQVLGRVLLMNHQEEMAAQTSAFAQIRLSEPLPIQANDRVIIRSFSPVELMGGAVVLHAHPKRRTVLTSTELALLEGRRRGDLAAVIQAHLQLTPYPTSIATIAQALDYEPSLVHQTLNALDNQPVVWGARDDSSQTDGYDQIFVVTREHLNAAVRQMGDHLLSFHKKNPKEAGMTRQVLKRELFEGCDERCVDYLIEAACQADAACVAKGLIGHPKILRDVILADEAGRKACMTALKEAGFAPVAIEELYGATGLDKRVGDRVLQAMALDGAVVRIGAGMVMETQSCAQAMRMIAQRLHSQGECSTSEFRELLGANRKMTIALLEYADKQRISLRSGDGRVLGPQGKQLLD